MLITIGTGSILSGGKAKFPSRSKAFPGLFDDDEGWRNTKASLLNYSLKHNLRERRE